MQTPEETSNASTHGQVIKTWVHYGTFWARIDPIRGRERFVAAQEISTVTNVITMRWTSATAGITPEHRIVYKNRIFSINMTRDLRERGMWLQMVCSEVIS